MSDVLYLAWRYLARHRLETAILVGSIALIVFIPVGLNVLVRQSETQLTARAGGTPLVMGTRGSPLELVLRTLYFTGDVPAPLDYGDVAAVAATGYAQAIPIHARFTAGDAPIVGTTLDYFEFRDLHVAAGRRMTRLGDCVLGAEIAQRRGLEAGSAILSSPESVFDLAGVYPLKMRVAGVLAPTGTADDRAVLVDVRTAWVIAGLGHGHQDLARPDAAAGVLAREGNRITANASVVQYNEITEDNAGSFHFHGDLAAMPITAIIAVPPDHKASTLLQGRYQSSETVQLVRPAMVMDDLLATILTVQHFVVAALVTVALATLATAVLVFLLSLRMRRRELDTMIRIGAAPGRVAAIIGAEIATVVAASLAIAAFLTWATAAFGADLFRSFLLQ